MNSFLKGLNPGLERKIPALLTRCIAAGLSEEVVRYISKAKQEPEWLLDWRLSAYRYWLKLKEPKWSELRYEAIDYQKISYYAAALDTSKNEVQDQLDKMLDLLGVVKKGGRESVALDVVVDSTSVRTTFQRTLGEKGIVFCSISDAVRRHPDLIRKYLGRVVSFRDNYFAALNAAVFSDGSFCYIPKGVRCPVELSTYFRINTAGVGQFERTLIIAEEGSYVSYLEGCTAPPYSGHQLHAAVVEILVEKSAEVRYATVQNWYAGDALGKGGVYNFVTKRGMCKGHYSRLSWTQLEAGAAATWKYPSCVLMGDHSVGEFYSLAVTNNYQQADTGTKMIHVGQATRSHIVAKGVSANHSKNVYRGLVQIGPGAGGAKNFSQCDSIIMGRGSSAKTIPYIQVKNKDAVVAHEASVSRLDAHKLFYCAQRGIMGERATTLLISGQCREVLAKLPMEFAQEARKLLQLKFSNAVG